jgi:hypothetical protein
MHPTPDAEGIAKTKELYLNRFGKAITDEQAHRVLGSVMRFIYLINQPCSDTPSTPENPTTTAS